MAARRRAGRMAKNVRVSATLSGSHSLGSAGVRGACGAIERALLGGTAEYAVQSMVPGEELTRHGGGGGSGLVAVRLDASLFMVAWDGESSFEAPPGMGAVGRCLGETGEVNVRVSAIIGDVAMDPPRIRGGALAARLGYATFGLGRPAGNAGGAAEGEIAFVGIATMAMEATATLAIFGERKSAMPAAPGMLERALDTLSGHCEALAK